MKIDVKKKKRERRQRRQNIDNFDNFDNDHDRLIDSSSSNPLTARRPTQSMAVPDTAVAASFAAVAPPSKSVVTFQHFTWKRVGKTLSFRKPLRRASIRIGLLDVKCDVV